MVQDHERMCKKETSLLKIHLIIPIIASPSLVHKLLFKKNPNENVNIIKKIQYQNIYQKIMLLI